MKMNNIYSAVPVNRTSALVTAQGGCASDGTLSDEQLRDNLVSRHNALQEAIIKLPKKSKERKRLGAIKQDVQIAISAIRPRIMHANLSEYIVDIVREEMTKFQFGRIITKAVERQKADQNR